MNQQSVPLRSLYCHISAVKSYHWVSFVKYQHLIFPWRRLLWFKSAVSFILPSLFCVIFQQVTSLVQINLHLAWNVPVCMNAIILKSIINCNNFFCFYWRNQYFIRYSIIWGSQHLQTVYKKIIINCPKFCNIHIYYCLYTDLSLSTRTWHVTLQCLRSQQTDTLLLWSNWQSSKLNIITVNRNGRKVNLLSQPTSIRMQKPWGQGSDCNRSPEGFSWSNLENKTKTILHIYFS